MAVRQAARSKHRMASNAGAALLCLCLASASASLAKDRSPATKTIPVLNGTVTGEQFRTLAADPALRDCTAKECVALKSVLASYDVLRRYYTPNTMARTEDNPPPAERPRLPVQVMLSENRHFLPLVSADLATIGGGVPGRPAQLLTIEIATLADTSGATAEQVVASIPRTAAFPGLVMAARERCDANGEPACAAIGPMAPVEPNPATSTSTTASGSSRP